MHPYAFPRVFCLWMMHAVCCPEKYFSSEIPMNAKQALVIFHYCSLFGCFECCVVIVISPYYANCRNCSWHRNPLKSTEIH